MRRDKSQSLPRTAYRYPAVTGGAFVSVAFLTALLASPTAASAVPLKPAGNTANLVLVCRFNGDSSDTYNSTSMTPSKTWWQSLMNAFNADDSTGEFKRYVGAASNGKVSVDSVFPQNSNGTLEYLDIDMNQSDYEGAPTDAQLFDSISRAFAAKYGSYDMTQANIDSDATTIDNVMVVMQTGSGDTFTSHQGEGSSIGGCKLNGLNVGSYEVIPSSRVGGVIGSLDAVPAHEYLHTYDALDLYRKVPANSSEKPAAYWDIMASASPTLLPLAVTSEDMGFGTINLVDAGEHNLGTYGTSNHAVAFKSPLNDNEYFVAEYRQGDLTASNGYVADKRLGNKGGFDTSKLKDGVVVYRVNPKYGTFERGGDGTGNTVNDYLYVFRPNDTAATHAGGDSLGTVESANLKAGSSIGSSDMSKGISDGAMCYSDGSNSGIVLKVVSAGNGSAKISIEKPDYDSLGLWNAVNGGNATIAAAGVTKVQTAAVGSRVYGLATGYKLTKLYELKDGAWTQIYSMDLSDSSIATDGKRLVLAGLDGNGFVHTEQWVDGENNSQSDISGYKLKSTRLSSYNGRISITSVTEDGTSVITGTFEDTTDYLLTEDANEILRIPGSNIVDAVMIDHDTLSVSDFASSNLTTYTFDADRGAWQKADTKRVSPRDSSSASFGGKTLLLTNSSSFGGKPSLRSVSNGTVSDVACDVLAANDSAVLSSDSAGFAMTVIHQDNGVMSAVVYRSIDGSSWTAEGSNVASPIMYASNVARLDGNDYCLTAADGVATLRSHASSDAPKATHTVRYVTGTDASIPNATVDDGDALPLPADPTRDGYRFLGWYDSETGGNRLDGTNAVTSDITVYARWERIIPTYTLNYDLNGGNGTIASVTLNEGDKVKIPATDPTRDGHKFLGWFTKSDGGDKVTADTVMSGNMTLYAHWERIIPTYTVTYDVNGGNGSIAQASVKEGGKVTIPAEKPTKDGYKFLGWFTAPDGGDKVTSDTVVNGDMTVYAQWERIIPTYTVRYDLNGGDGTIAPASIKEGEKVAIPTDPTRGGYKFLGWFTASTEGDKVTADTVVNGDMTVYAQWERIIPTYTVSYDVNGGNESYRDATVSEGGKVTLPADPTRDGYKFLGWFTERNGGSEVSSDTVVTGNMTVHAHWERIIPTYTVSYDVNGGNGSYSPTTVKEGEKITLPADPTREGYEFLGWFTAPTGGDRVTGDTVVTDTMTLYAHWDEIETTFALTYDTDGGEHIDSVTLADGDKLPLPTPARRGYTFLGWYDAKTGGNRLVPGTSTISGNMTAYARWQKETTGENTNAGGNTNGNGNTNTETNGNTGSGNSNENTGSNIGNGSNGSNGSTSHDDNLLGNVTGGKDGKNDGTENGKLKLPTMLQQTGVTVSIFAAIGAAIGAVAAIVAAIRKRK